MTEQAKPFKRIQNQIGAPPVPASGTTTAPGRATTAEQQAGQYQPAERRSVLDSLVAGGRINWELIIWLVIIALAIATRLWALGDRAMHHDENNHSWFSYDMYKGINVYRYDPTWHGPVLYYMVTLSYFILGGATEFSARFAPAVFGIGLVAICYLLRPFLGKLGAIIFAVLMLVSPSILYYSRSLRHDIFATFGTLLFVTALFRFALAKSGTRKELKWIGLAGLGFFVLFGSHEMSFLNLAIVLSWLGMVFLFEIVVLPGKFRIGSRKSKIEDLKTANEDLQQIEPAISDQPGIENGLAAEEVQEDIIPSAEAPEAEGQTPEEAVAVTSLETSQPGERVDPILGRFRTVYFSLFGIFAALVLVGSIHLFVDKTSDGSLQKLFGVNAYLTLIPLYILLSAAIAYPLARFINFGYNRLGSRSSFIARVAAIVAFVGLGGVAALLFLRGASAATLVTAANLQFSGSNSLFIDKAISDYSPFSQFSYVGLTWPSLLPQLAAVLIAALLFGMLVGWLWERRMLVYTRNGIYTFVIAALFVLLVASLISLRFVLVPDGTPLPKGSLPVLGAMDKWLAYVIGGAVLALVIGLVAGWFVAMAEQIEDRRLYGSVLVRSVLKFARTPWLVVILLVSFGVPYVLIFSNFFFSPERLADGFYRGVEYWAEQHATRRLDEPWFYYPMLMLLYETFAVIFTFVALVYFPVSWWRRTVARGRFIFTAKGVFIGLSFWWSFAALVAYSIAGEKVPWLNMQVALPFSLATAAFLNEYLSRVNWKRVLAWKEGLLFAALVIGMFAALMVLIGQAISFPKQGIYSPNLGRAATSTDVTVSIVTMLLVGAVGLALFGVSLWMWWGYRLSSRTARTVLVLLMGGLVFAYCVRSTILLNYDHPDTAVEPMIYTQTTPEIPLFVQRIARLGRDIRDTNKIAPASSPNGLPPIDPDPGNIKGLPIFVSGEVANPFNWYFREYNDITWGQVKNDPGTTSPIDKLSDARGNNFVVIMVSAGENTSALQQELAGQYTSHQYKLRWNFPEDESGYGGLGYDPPDDPREYRIAVKDIINTRWDLILRSFTEQPYAGRLWRYLMYRQLWLPLPSFDMVAYIRNDVDPQFNATAPANPVPGLPTLPALTAGSNLPALDLTASSSAGVGDGQYNVPRNVAVAPNGDILVLDSLNGRVQRFDKDGKFLSKFGSVGTGDGQFTLPKAQLGPGGIAVDEDGNIYVTDTWGYRIEKFDKDGKLLLKWGEGVDTKGDPAQNQQALTGFYGPRSIAYDRAAGELYITDTGNRRVMVFNKQGQYVRQFGSSGSGPGQFDEPVSVALSPDGKVYVADLRNKRIQILDKQGAYLGQISMPQWQEADLSEPYLAFDAQGQLYASIPTSGSVVRLDASGQITATYNTTNGANLQNPIGLAFDSDGNLYVADGRRSAIVKIKPQ